MICRKSVLGAVILMAAGTPGYAQEVQSYQYDVHGRLTSVTRTTGSTNQTTTYALDKADNRTSRSTGAATSASTVLESSELPSENIEAGRSAQVDTDLENTTEEVPNSTPLSVGGPL